MNLSGSTDRKELVEKGKGRHVQGMDPKTGGGDMSTLRH